MKGEWPLSVWGLRGEGVEVFGHREALVSGIHHQLPFLEHVHELDAGQRCLCGGSRTRWLRIMFRALSRSVCVV
jgi:hypothetical protein